MRKRRNDSNPRIPEALADEQNLDALDAYIEDEELLEELEGTDIDDPCAREKLMELKKRRASMRQIW